MSSKAATVWTAAVAGAVAGLLSVGRLLLGNPSALSTIVWAEDGLFALCARANGPVPCLVEPYAGYLLFLPRVIAWPVSWFPLDTWPLVTNLAAAALAVTSAALVVLVLRASGVGVVAAGFAAILPVLVPIAGFEAINVYSSGYLLLVFVAVLALSFPPRGAFPTWAYAAGLLVVGLTMPSTVVLLGVLAVQMLRRRIPRTGGAVAGVALIAGLAAQVWAALTTEVPRPISISLDSLMAWVRAVPDALMTVVPGQGSLTAAGTIAPTTLGSVGWAGPVIVLAVVVGGTWLILRRDAVVSGLGLLILAALALGCVPAIAGYANNRYFVIPIVLWIAAAVIALDRWFPWRPNLAVAVVVVLVTALWTPELETSTIRSTAAPEWPPMLAQARALCAEYPDGTATLTFSPGWPFPDAVFPGVTSNTAACSMFR